MLTTLTPRWQALHPYLARRRDRMLTLMLQRTQVDWLARRSALSLAWPYESQRAPYPPYHASPWDQIARWDCLQIPFEGLARDQGVAWGFEQERIQA